MKYLITLAFLIMCTSWCKTQPYTIYPIPQRLEAMEGQHLLTKTVTVVCDADIDAATRQRAKQVLEESGFFCKFAKKASPLTSNLQLKTDPSVAMEGKYDSYTLYIYEDGISITGQHTNAVFFGLASLEQMLEQTTREDASDEKRYLPFASITDYADLQNRGVVEGYYGFPYRAAVRQDLMRFMMRYKMNTYLYGGKSDPFHSQYWQQPYPKSITEEQEQNGWMSQGQMAEVARLSAESKVNFIWAIHPGDSIIDSPTVVDDIMNKFAMMHQLGIRQFALFVDDVFIPTEQADMELTAQRVTKLQQAIEQRWNQPYHNAKNAARAKVSAQDTVRPLHFVPQIYCSGFADSDDQRIRFMNAIGKIPTQITVYTTGQWVWTVPNNEHTAQVKSEFGRQMSWWWNYPCNDNADGFIYPMDMYSNFSDMPAVRSSALLPNELTDNAGLVANPMQQGMICKTPLFSVADYAWNNHAFDNKKSWEASFKAVLSDSIQQQAYRYLAEYLRPIDSDRHLTRSINDYRESLDCRDTMMLQERSTALRDYLNWILGQCEVLVQLQHSAIERERLLYADLSPWLHKLQAECSSALLLMDEVEALLAGKDDVPSHAARVAIDLDTNPQYSVLALEGMGESITTSKRQATVSNRHLSPFVDYLIRKTLSLRKMH